MTVTKQAGRSAFGSRSQATEAERRDDRRRRSVSIRDRRRKGFALLVVIWGLGVVSLLVVSFASSSRLRLRAAFDVAGAVRAKLLSDGAVDIAIMTLLAERADGETGALHDGAPLLCELEGAAVVIAIEDEGGKVDINSAPPELLKALLAALDVDTRRADIAAHAIIDFRTPPTREIGLATRIVDPDKPFPPKHGHFDSVLELDQVYGVDPPLFREMIPFVTIDRRGLSSAHRLKRGVDPLVTPPALFAALAGFSNEDVRALKTAPFPNRLDREDPRFRPAFKATSEHGAFLIHTEALLSTGHAAVSETSIDLRADGGAQPYIVRESRQGATRYVERLRLAFVNGAASSLASCWSR